MFKKRLKGIKIEVQEIKRMFQEVKTGIVILFFMHCSFPFIQAIHKVRLFTIFQRPFVFVSRKELPLPQSP
jgi:hypothetical protein